MRIGVLSDPHGCLVGLRAALSWLDQSGVDLVVCAGDVAAFGPQPNECVALLSERGIPTVQGNSDRDLLWSAHIPPVPPAADARTAQIAVIEDWCREQLTPTSREWLAALPPDWIPAPGVLVVHGAPGDPTAIVTADSMPIFPSGVTTVAAGHLHTPFILRTKRGLWVNAGSVGRPCDGDPRAAIAVLERQPTGWDAFIHRIPFDLEAAAQAIREAKMPYAERLIETQVQARWW